MIKILPPGLHVILGDSAGGIFTRVYFARDRLLIDQDVLSCGPTPRTSDLDAWRKLRFDYWSSFVPGGASEHVPSRFNLVDNARRLADAECVNIWSATGVSEQVFIAFAVHLVKLVGGDPARIAIVECEMMNGRRIIDLSELNDAQMRAAPEPKAMREDVAQHYLNAWAALTSPDPLPLSNFAREHPEANRWLKLATQLMSRRFPDKRSGLSYWDHALLSRIEKRGPGASGIIGYTIADTFGQGDLVGDWYLFGRLLKLGSVSNPQPLITLSGEQTSIRSTEAALTSLGAASNYPANPIDDWAAGVRLSSAEGSLWFNDGGKLIKERGAS